MGRKICRQLSWTLTVGALCVGCGDETDSREDGVEPAQRLESFPGGKGDVASSSGLFSPAAEAIVGGRDTAIEAVPWQVSLRTPHPRSGRLEHSCGGSIVHERWILTAGHCLVDVRTVEVAAGITSRFDRGGQRRFAVRAHVPPGFSLNPAAQNDIALLELNEPLDLNGRTVSLVPIATPAFAAQGFEEPGQIGVISGWGKQSGGFFAGPASTLQSVALPIFDLETARSMWSRNAQQIDPFDLQLSTIDERLIPIGDPGGVSSACQGDSGGPLVVAGPANEAVLAGVTSWGDPQCRASVSPSFYTRVSAFEAWIGATMAPDAPTTIDDQPGTRPSLVITEVLAEPAGLVDANEDGRVDANDEFIEFINAGESAFEMGGVSIATSAGPIGTFPEGFELEPGEFVVIYGGPDAPTLQGARVFVVPRGLDLDDASERVTLTGGDGQTLSVIDLGALAGESLALDPESNTYRAHTDFSSEPASPGRL